MTKVQITVRLAKRYQINGKKYLKLESPIFDRTSIPASGDTLRIGELLQTVEFHRRFSIVGRTLTWAADGSDFYHLDAEADFREMTTLAVVSNWHVADGLSELTKAQQELIACATGTCMHESRVA